MSNILLGAHMSISGSIDQSVDRAKDLGCTTFQIFTGNPRGWYINTLNDNITKLFIEKIKKNNYNKIVTHMPYLPNLATSNDIIFNKSVKTLKNELIKCDKLAIPYLVTHLGSHLGKGIEVGIENVTKALRLTLEEVDNNVKILLENMVGTKNSVGSKFENIIKIINGVDNQDKLGVCFDTCHAFAAGYELRNLEGIDNTLKNFDEIIGINKLKVIHLNDSMGEFNCNRDRHQHIGLGYIGENGFKTFVNDSRIKDLPMILETPINNERDDVGNLLEIKTYLNEK